MSRIRTRLERLERQQPARGGVHWDNLLARSPEEIVPDGIIDWYDLLFGPRTDQKCPIEEEIRLAGLPRPDQRLGDTTPFH
jgi:hypothetical protein